MARQCPEKKLSFPIHVTSNDGRLVIVRFRSTLYLADNRETSCAVLCLRNNAVPGVINSTSCGKCGIVAEAIAFPSSCRQKSIIKRIIEAERTCKKVEVWKNPRLNKGLEAWYVGTNLLAGIESNCHECALDPNYLDQYAENHEENIRVGWTCCASLMAFDFKYKD